MGFWAVFFLDVAMTVVQVLLQKAPKGAKPSGLGEFQVPTAEEGRSVPMVLGTCKIKGPNVTWWGDLVVKAIKKKTPGFLGIGRKSYTAGYKYYLGMMIALCSGPADELVDIVAGEKSLKAAGAALPKAYVAGGTSFDISLPDLFGGDEKEGGLAGTLQVYFGSSTQGGNAYLASKWGGSAPGFRGLCYVSMNRIYIGTTAYLKDMAWVVRACPAPGGLNPAKANIDGDCNPAYGIAHILTHDQELGGLGLAITRLDLGAFQSAADRLWLEGFGISLLMDSAKSADEWIGEICRTIDATCYTDPQTGLWTLKLIRADYVPADLPTFSEDEVLSAPEFSRASWADTLNKIVIRYPDRTNGYQTRTAQDQDAANRAVRGGEVAEAVMDFLCISRPSIAQLVAARERRTHSYPLAQVKNLVLTRKAWALRPGSPLKFSWAPMGISDMVLRVTEIRYGTLEGGAISVDAVEDIFGIAATGYAPPPDSGWIDPVGAPVAVTAQALLEAPFWLAGEARKVLVMGARASLSTQSAEIWTSESGGSWLETSEMESLTPTGTLTGSWSAKTAAIDTAGFTVGSGVDLDRLPEHSTDAAGRNAGTNLALVGNEIISWTTATDNGNGTVTLSGVLRGVLDTVPEDHASGDRVWFLSQGTAFTRLDAESEGLPPATSDTLGGVKVGTGLTAAADGTLALKPATASSLGGVKIGSGLSVGEDGTLSASGGAGGVPPDYIAGLVPKWVSATSLSVSPGKAYIPSLSDALAVPSAITKTSLSLSASTWYHLYLFSNGGTPDLEVSTTAPEPDPYAGTARTKDEVTSRRYLGSIRTDASGNILPFEAILRGNSLEVNPGMRLVNGATDEQTVVSLDASAALFSEVVDYLLLSFTLQSQAVFVAVKVHTDNGIATRAQCNHQEAIGLSGYTAYTDYVFPRPLKRTPGSTTLYWWRRTWSGSTGGALYIDVHAFGLLR